MKLTVKAPAPDLVDAALDQQIHRDDARKVRVRDLIDLLHAAGMRVYIVGGAPRDWLGGEAGKDIDLCVDRPIEQVYALLSEAFSGLDNLRIWNERYGILRCGDSQAGGLDINMLRSWKDIQNDDMWTTRFVARSDLVEDAQMRDFSINVFYYDCRQRSLIDPLGCGVDDLEAKTLRLVTHRRVLDTSFRTTFRIAQFLVRGYSATANVLEHLERYADHDIQGMGSRIRRWIPNHFGAETASLPAFKHLLYAHARQPASIDTLDSFFY
jgi:poly(A) polymerase